MCSGKQLKSYVCLLLQCRLMVHPYTIVRARTSWVIRLFTRVMVQYVLVIRPNDNFVTSCHIMETWESGFRALLILNLNMRWRSLVRFMFRPFYPRIRLPSTHCVASWLSSKISLVFLQERKMWCPCRKSNNDDWIPQDFPAYVHNSLSSDAFRLMRGPSSGSTDILKSACI